MMRTLARQGVFLVLIFVLGAMVASAAEFNIRDYGAKANDAADDTLAIRAALDACGKAGGGTVLVPAGTYLVARQASGDPILPIPSNTSVRGEGAKPSVRFAGIVLKWVRGDREANMRRLVPLVREAAAGGAKIVCTTECFLDGYAIADKSIPLDVYQSYGESIPGGKFYRQLAELARELKIYLVAGIHEVEQNKHFNTAVLIGPDGTLVGKYHKQKLEHELVRNQPGNQCPTFRTAYGRVGLMICADRTEAAIVRGLCRDAGADFDLPIRRDVRSEEQRSDRSEALARDGAIHPVCASGGVLGDGPRRRQCELHGVGNQAADPARQPR